MLEGLLNSSKPKLLFDDKLVLKSERITLRGKKDTDLSKDYFWRIDPELTRLDAAQPLLLDRYDFALYHQYDLENVRSDTAKLAIDTAAGEYVGNCVFYHIEMNQKRSEFGIMIGERRYWDQGIGTEAILLACEHIFTHTELKLLYLHTLMSNRRAIHCFEKCGFEIVCMLPNGEFDFFRMELTAENFAKKLNKRKNSMANGSF